MSDFKGLYLWETVHDTPQQYQKAFSGRSGGFAGTAIDPTYLVMHATDLWGPIGARWGYEIVKEEYVQGEPIVHYPTTEGLIPTVLGHITVHKIQLKLWYPVLLPTGEETTGYVEQFGQTTYIGRNKNGLFTDEEHAKKSVTDALSKCLSLLGFGADVRIGKFYDTGYADPEPPEPQSQTTKSLPDKISAEQKKVIDDTLKQMKREWAALATVCSAQLKRQVASMDDLSGAEATKVIAFLQGRVGK